MSVTDTPTGSPFPLWPTNERLHRLEWLRFAVACAMVGVVILEAVLLFSIQWYSMWVWLAAIIVLAAVLQLLTRMIARERALAIEDWTAEVERLMTRVRRDA